MLSGKKIPRLTQVVSTTEHKHRGKSALITIALLSGLVVLQGCSPDKAPVAATQVVQQATLPLGDTSQNALDWAGSYQGVLPCASCEGIETRLTLFPDGNYHLATIYLGEEPDNEFEQQGKFHWDEAGRVIKLDAAEGDPMYFRVEENAVRQLDLAGDVITGPLAEHYRLHKLPDAVDATESAAAIAGFTGIDWQLIELLGDTISEDTTTFVHFSAEGKVYGYAGCNQFSGSWVLEQQRLRLGDMISTMRACPEPQMQLEQVFLAQLAMADNYTLAEQTLSLNKARMAPLARFTVKQ